MKSERRTHQRTKHLDVILWGISMPELEEKGEIAVTWIPTSDMIADLMTKPLKGNAFTYLSKLISGNNQIENSN